MGDKAVFLDVDGTLVNERGQIPQSARAAVAAARANGHRVFLATGRSTSELWPEIIDVGFDGLVAAAGGYVEIDGQVLVKRHLSRAQVRHVVEFFDSHGVEYFLEANSGLYGSPNSKQRLAELMFHGALDEADRRQRETGFGGFIESLQVGATDVRDDINKVSFLDSDVPFAQIQAEFGPYFEVIPATVALWGPNSGELSLPGVHKAAAIEVVIDHLGIPLTDTIAFGDGLNDVEMIQFVGVGVAMGNAHPAVLAVADRVTGTPDEDGIHVGFAELGLLVPSTMAG